MQRVDLGSRAGAFTVAFAAAIVVVASAGSVWLAPPSPESWGTFAAFALLIAASALTEVSLSNDEPYPLGLAPALAYSLFGHHPLPQTILVFAAGTLLASVLRALRKRPVRPVHTSVQVLALAAGAAAMRAISVVAPDPAFRTSDGEAVIPLLGVFVMLAVVAGIETLSHAALSSSRDGTPVQAAARDRGRASIAVHLSQISVAALLALSYPSLGAWAFPLFLAPLAATRYAFTQYSSIRSTYLQTIRALSKVPEMAGYTADGHSARVASAAVAVARELGIDAATVKEIEYAALLHDIGRVSLPEPGPPEAGDRKKLAEIGGQIVRETRHFPRVAEMIEHQHADAVSSVGPVGSRIIRVCSDLDDLAAAHGREDALARIRAGAGLRYDPDVVRALDEVAGRLSVA